MNIALVERTGYGYIVIDMNNNVRDAILSHVKYYDSCPEEVVVARLKFVPNGVEVGDELNDLSFIDNGDVLEKTLAVYLSDGTFELDF